MSENSEIKETKLPRMYLVDVRTKSYPIVEVLNIRGCVQVRKIEGSASLFRPLSFKGVLCATLSEAIALINPTEQKKAFYVSGNNEVKECFLVEDRIYSEGQGYWWNSLRRRSAVFPTAAAARKKAIAGLEKEAKDYAKKVKNLRAQIRKLKAAK